LNDRGASSNSKVFQIWSDGGELVFSAINDNESLKSTNFVLDQNSRISLSNNDSGTSNTIFGKNAGDSDGAGDLNVFIGELAGGTGTQTDDADSNVSISYRALTDLTEGTHNIAIGKDSATNMLGGDMNIAIGSDTLYTSTAAIHSIAIGKNAMYGGTASSSTGSIAIGYDSLRNVSSGVGNVAVGYEAGNAIADDNNNTLIGYQSGKVTTGADNTYVGFSAGKGAAGAESFNVGVGSSALTVVVAGSNNSVVGESAGAAITSGSNNVIMGRHAGATLTDGGDNVLLGRSAGLLIAAGTTTNGTVAVGAYAGDAITTSLHSEENTLLGHSAGTTLSTGDGNVAVGAFALDAELTGHKSTAVGYNSLTAQVNSGDVDAKNTAVGYQSAVGLTTGTLNTAIGSGALSGADGAETENVCVGASAGSNIDGGSNCVIVGANAQASTAAASNQIVIGKDCAGQANHSVTLGNADVTDVYMAEDSGAVIHASAIRTAGRVHTGTTGLGTLTPDGLDQADGGFIEFVISQTGTFAIDDTLVFTYAKTSWSAFLLEIEMMSTLGYSKFKLGGYNNNGFNIHTYEDDTGADGALTGTNSSQSNVFTLTANANAIHPTFKFKYTQGGGDGAPTLAKCSVVWSIA